MILISLMAISGTLVIAEIWIPKPEEVSVVMTISRAISQIVTSSVAPLTNGITVISSSSLDNTQDERISEKILSKVLELTSNDVSDQFLRVNTTDRVESYRLYNLIIVDDLVELESV